MSTGILNYDELCRLSRLFNERANLGLSQDMRINEWLKAAIAAEGAIEATTMERLDDDYNVTQKGLWQDITELRASCEAWKAKYNASVAAALEEAAKLVEDEDGSLGGWPSSLSSTADLAAAIRAMKEQP